MSDMAGQAAEQSFRDLVHFSEVLIRLMNDLATRMGDYIKFTQAEAMKVNCNNEPKINAIFSDGGLSPSISTSYLYEQHLSGKSLEEVAKSGIDFAKSCHIADLKFSVEDLCKTNAPDHLYFQLINRDINPGIESNCPCKIKNDDLMAVARWHVEGGDETGQASILVTDSLAQHLEMTKDEIFKTCQENLDKEEFTVKGMSETMMEILHEQGAPEDYIQDMMDSIRGEQEQMYVITNMSKIDGSVAMLSDSCMTAAREKIGEDFYLLPSSRHEVLAVPMSSVAEPRQLLDMVKEVNATEVSKADFLADNVFAYLGKAHEIVPCFDKVGKAIDLSVKVAETLTQKAFAEPDINKGRTM